MSGGGAATADANREGRDSPETARQGVRGQFSVTRGVFSVVAASQLNRGEVSTRSRTNRGGSRTRAPTTIPIAARHLPLVEVVRQPAIPETIAATPLKDVTTRIPMGPECAFDPDEKNNRRNTTPTAPHTRLTQGNASVVHRTPSVAVTLGSASGVEGIPGRQPDEAVCLSVSCPMDSLS